MDYDYKDPEPKGITYDNQSILIKCPFCGKTHIHYCIGLRTTPCKQQYRILSSNIIDKSQSTELIITRRLDAI